MKRLLGKGTAASTATSSHTHNRKSNSVTPFDLSDHQHPQNEQDEYTLSQQHPRHNPRQPPQLYTNVPPSKYSDDSTPTTTPDAIAAAYPSYGQELASTDPSDGPHRRVNTKFPHPPTRHHHHPSTASAHSQSDSHSSASHVFPSQNSHASHGTSTSADDYSLINWSSPSSESYDVGAQNQQHSKTMPAWATKAFSKINNSSAAPSSKAHADTSDPNRDLAGSRSDHERDALPYALESMFKPKRVKSIGKSTARAPKITHWDGVDDSVDDYDGVRTPYGMPPGSHTVKSDHNTARNELSDRSYEPHLEDDMTYSHTYSHGPSMSPDALTSIDRSKTPGNKKGFWAGLAGSNKSTSRDMLPSASLPDDHLQKKAPSSLVSNALRFDVKSKVLSKSGPHASDQALSSHPEGDVTAKIGWLCAQESLSPAEWALLPLLTQIIVHSDASAAKEAARALRKEFKWGETHTRLRAIKVWAFLTLHSSETFRLQVANKKFLEVLEHIMTNTKVSLALKERLLEAWAILAYEYKNDPELSSITKAYNKVRPNDRPANGQLVDLERHDLFLVPAYKPQGPKSSLPIERSSLPSHADQANNRFVSEDTTPYGQKHDGVPGQPGAARSRTEVDSVVQSLQQTQISATTGSGIPLMIMDEEDILAIAQACESTRVDSNALIDIVTNESEGGVETRAARDLYDQVNHDEDVLASQMSWVSAQAAHSRAQTQALQAHSAFDGRGSFSDARSEQTREEILLADMVSAKEQASAALSIYSQAKEDQEEKEQERQVTELSKVDYRIDRSTLAQDAESGMLMEARGDESRGRLQVPVMDRAAASSASSAGSGGGPRAGSRGVSPRRGPRPLPSATENRTLPNPGLVAPNTYSANRTSLNSSAASLQTPASTLAAPPMALAISSESHSSAVRLDRPSPAELAVEVSQMFSSSKPVIVADTGALTSQDIYDSWVPPSEKALGKRRAISPNLDGHARAEPAGVLPSTDTGAPMNTTTINDEWQSLVGGLQDVSQQQKQAPSLLPTQEAHVTLQQHVEPLPPSLPPVPAAYLAEQQQHTRNPYYQQERAPQQQNPSSAQHSQPHFTPSVNTTQPHPQPPRYPQQDSFSAAHASAIQSHRFSQPVQQHQHSVSYNVSRRPSAPADSFTADSHSGQLRGNPFFDDGQQQQQQQHRMQKQPHGNALPVSGSMARPGEKYHVGQVISRGSPNPWESNGTQSGVDARLAQRYEGRLKNPFEQ